MWLLSTDRAELHHFADHTAVRGGYAILSHTWGSKEQSLQDLQSIKQKCQLDGTNPRDSDYVSEKIRGSCILAEKGGYDWIWVDSCCIDKTSSSELSEAINSMFEWYLRSDVCYALLEDVHSTCDLRAHDSAFRKARWHTRGWTLQELIAPSTLIFISREWQFLGTKLELADVLYEITSVSSAILTHQRHFSNQSVARRMSWASRRKTTRVEDEAYCLMGLFGVNMPTIYGEGRRAFQRLQEEILKRTSDMSLFAWGPARPLEASGEPVDAAQIGNIGAFLQEYASLFAQSPAVYDDPSYIAYTPTLRQPLQPYLPWQWKAEHKEPEDSIRRLRGPFGELELPKITSIMSNEVQGRFPIIEIDGITIAILLCENNQAHYGLLLHRSPKFIQDPKRLLYRAGCGFNTDHGTMYVRRLVTLGNDYYSMTLKGKKVTAEWRDISLEQNDSYQDSRHLITISSRLNNLAQSRYPLFHFPVWLITRLQAVGFNVFSVSEEGQSNISGRPLVLLCTNGSRHESLTFVMGKCAGTSESAYDVHDGKPFPFSRWARVSIEHPGNWGTTPAHTGHNCSQDHIMAWQDWAKVFGDAERTVRLSFTRWPVIPGANTLAMHVELEGRCYKDITREANVSLP